MTMVYVRTVTIVELERKQELKLPLKVEYMRLGFWLEGAKGGMCFQGWFWLFDPSNWWIRLLFWEGLHHSKNGD